MPTYNAAQPPYVEDPGAPGGKDHPLVATTVRVMDLGDYVRIVRARKWLVLLVTLVGVDLAILWLFLQPTNYFAQAKLVVPATGNPLLPGSSDVQPDLAVEAEIVRSRVVATAVHDELGTTESVDALIKNVRVETIEDGGVLYVGYLAADPVTAAETANAFANAYLENRAQQIAQQVEEATGAYQDDLDALWSQYEDTLKQLAEESDRFLISQLETRADLVLTRINTLEAKITDIEATGLTSQRAQLVQQATEPSSATGPNLVFAVMVGLVLGFAGGVAAAVLRTMAQDRVRTGDELATQLGAPVMGLIPRVQSWADAERPELIVRDDPRDAASEAYRTLATNIRFAASVSSLDVFVVSSAMPGEGKSVTAANLAWVLAEAGQHVLLIGGDLRRPRAHEFFEIEQGPGVTEALRARANLSEVVRSTPLANLHVVPSGGIPTDPAALLASAATEQLLLQARRAADLVIIDAPPILPVADASILASLSDGLLFVHDPSISTRAALTDSKSQLQAAGIEVLGSVYNNLDQGKRSLLGYARYDAYYESEEEPTTTMGEFRKTLQRVRFQPRSVLRGGEERAAAGRSERDGRAPAVRPERERRAAAGSDRRRSGEEPQPDRKRSGDEEPMERRRSTEDGAGRPERRSSGAQSRTRP